MSYQSERRGKYEAAVVYVVQSLIVVAIVAGVGSWSRGWVNSTAIESIRIILDTHSRSMQELARSQNETALINATQTQQLVFMNEMLKECKQDAKAFCGK